MTFSWRGGTLSASSRRRTRGALAGSPTQEKKSKYTSDRSMPGAFEGETVTRRTLMNLGAQRRRGRRVAAFTLPALGFALAPDLQDASRSSWQTIGTPGDFNETTYVTKVITITPGIGEAGNSIAYVRTAQPRDRHRARGRVQPLGRAVVALHAPGLPGPLRRGRRALHLPLPRRRLRLPRHGRRRPAGAPAGPLLHPPERDDRPGRDRPALLGQLRAAALLPARPGRAARRHRPVPVPARSSPRPQEA